MKKTISITIAILAMLGMLFAQPVMNPKVVVPPNPNDNPNLVDRPGVEVMDMLQNMKLNDAQKGKLTDLWINHKKQMNLLDAEIENLRIDLRQAMKKEDFTVAKKVAADISQKTLTRDIARIEFLQAILKELTPEQKEMFKEQFLNQMGKMGCGKHQGGPGMGHCGNHDGGQTPPDAPKDPNCPNHNMNTPKGEVPK